MPSLRRRAVRVSVPVRQPTIRAPRDDERARVAEVLSTSLNLPRDMAAGRSHLYPVDDMRGAIVDGEIVATAGEFRFDQWFAGKALGCSAIWGVATSPSIEGRASRQPRPKR